jgi:hypothetical protein
MTSVPENSRLDPSFQKYLEVEGRQRIDMCWDKIFIRTKDAAAAFNEMQDCMNAAPSTKPRGLIIIGEPDTGKSKTMTEFRNRNLPERDPDSEYAEHPVVYMKAPNDPNPTVFLKKLLDSLGYPIRYNATTSEIFAYAIRMLKHCKVGTVIVDEFRDIGSANISQKIIDFFVFFKNLINETERPFIVGGTPDLLNFISSDRNLVGRLDQVVRLERLEFNEFIKVLLAFERLVPLRKASNFHENEQLIQNLYSHSGGYIGEINRLLEDACKLAITSNEERITLSTIDRITYKRSRSRVPELA